MKAISYANRGMKLETLIDYANQQYAQKGMAIIQKIPTPWKVVRKGTQIISAFPEKQSTVDFIGAYKGRPIAFDAKSTKIETNFPLANVEDHQLRFMKKWEQNGGSAFVLVEFVTLDEIYVLPYTYVDDYKRLSGRKSIAIADVRNNGHKVKEGRGIVLDYLRHVEATTA